MIIELAKTSGFCFGVKNAVDKAYKIIDDKSGKYFGEKYMYGKLIHNKIVLDDLQKEIKIAENLEDIADDSTVIIRAHGVTPDVIESLSKKGCNIVDLTCPYVTKIHNIVKNACNDNKNTIIVGDKNHPEVIGINGECNNQSLIIYDLDEFLNYPFEENSTVVVAQTTYSYIKYREICDFLKKKIANLEIFDTICNTTEKRQQESMELSARSDMMIVIGSRTSSNTMRLFELCKSNCQKTYMVEKLNDLDEIFNDEKFIEYRIGVVAGASTPQRIIGEVINKMSEKGGLESQQEKDNLYFSEYIDSISQLHRGATVKGAVIRYDNEFVYIDVHDKSEGRIPVHEFSVDAEYDLDDAVANHTEVDVYVRSIRNTDQGKEIILSKARIDFSKNKDLVEKAFIEKEPINVKITKSVKDGIIGSVGSVDIYIHRTQIEMGVVNDLDAYIGREFEILVTQFDPDKRRLRVSGSRRILLNQERKEKAEELWSEIKNGDVYKGIVRSLTDFGAFVDIGGVDGLIHVSELSWERISHPSDIVKPGEEIEVYIKDFDEEKRRISLGYKKAKDDPYKGIEESYPVGSNITGKVVRMFPFGAFIELEPGVDALCHISQISNVRLVKPSDALEEGMEVTAKVLEVDSESRRISVSIKEVEPIDPVKSEESIQQDEVEEEVDQEVEEKVDQEVEEKVDQDVETSNDPEEIQDTKESETTES